MPDMTPDQAIQTLKTLPEDRQRAILARLSPDVKRGIMAKLTAHSSAPISPTGTIGPLDTMGRFSITYPVGAKGEGVGEDLYNMAQNAGVAAYQLLAHPVHAAESFVASLIPESIMKAGLGKDYESDPYAHTPNPVQATYSGLNTRPGETISQMAGQGLALGAVAEAVPEIAGPITRSLKEKVTNARENFGSAPKTVRDLVKNTRKENAATEKNNAEVPQKQQEYQHELEVREAANKAKITKHAEDVKATEEENARAAQEHEQAVQVVDAENTAKTEKYRNDVEAVKRENEQNQAQYETEKKRAEGLKAAAKQQETFRGRLARQVQENGQRLVNRIREVQAKWKDSSALQKAKDYKPTGILDRGYDQVRKATASESVPGGDLVSAVQSAEQKISGSTENIKQFRDILSKGSEESPAFIESPSEGKIPKGHALYDVLLEMSKEGKSTSFSFKDLQGYYSEIGEKLSQGNLPPDVYQALQSLHRSIGGMMQGLADHAGVGSLLRRLQAQYADYMQTFRETAGTNHSGSPIAMALEAKDPAYAVEPLMREETASRVRNALTRFDKDQGGAAAIYDNLRTANRAFDKVEAVKVPKEPTAPNVNPEPEAPGLKARPTPPTEKPAPEYPSLAEKPTPPEPAKATRKIDERDIRERKASNLEQSVSTAQKHIFWWSTVWPAFRAISDAARGELPGLGTFTPMAAGAGVNMILDRVFQNPKVIDFFTRATPKDIAEVPVDLRGNLPQIVKAAQSRGIKISPALAALVGVAKGPKTQQLRQARDHGRYAHVATNSSGHRIGSNDGQNWVDTETGEPVNGQ